MKKIAAKLTRGATANVLGIAGAVCLVAGAWHWNLVAGLVSLGLALVVTGWAVDE